MNEDEYSRLLKKKDDLLKQKEKNEKLRQLRGEVYRLENPRKVALVDAITKGVKNVFTPKPQDLARKAKLKKKVASVADVNKALDPLMKL